MSLYLQASFCIKFTSINLSMFLTTTKRPIIKLEMYLKQLMFLFIVKLMFENKKLLTYFLKLLSKGFFLIFSTKNLRHFKYTKAINYFQIVFNLKKFVPFIKSVYSLHFTLA